MNDDDQHEDGPLLHEVIRALQEELAAANAERARLRDALERVGVTWYPRDAYWKCRLCQWTAKERDGIHDDDCLLATAPSPPTTAHDGLTTTEGA